MPARPHRNLLLRKSAETFWKMPFRRSELDGIFSALLKAAGQARACVELIILDDAAMSGLHEKSLGCTGPTNVLSFPAVFSGPRPDGFSHGFEDNNTQNSPMLIGWLALSVDTLLRESYLYGQNAGEHCLRLLAHGLAHILGHDHGPGMDALCEKLESAAGSVVAPTP